MVSRFGQPIKVNWAYASGQREDTSGLFTFSFLLLRTNMDDTLVFIS